MNVTGIQDDEINQQRRPPGRRLALAILLAVVIGGVSWAVWTTRSSSGHRLIYTKTLSDGRVFQCFSDGASIGSPGSKVDSRPAPEAPDGSEGGPALVLRPPDFTEEEARRAAEEYKKSGRTPEQDQADFDRLSAECRRRR
jgi:hypothetical protein